ncbi:hypothetical protein BV20DRAFT_968105 [Pilatotrama ljubarskyi]|nr:hypothetical protein BV20DRAFT_968105 [Pilatotrama ljubarskyi]
MSPTVASDDSSAANQPSASGKAKQTRRRQRLSCVECTRRRQKCDRQIPCGLCVSRGVPHLCRWEPLVARPAPQRPPEGAPIVPAESAQSTIAALSARISALEDVISRQNMQIRGLADSNDGSLKAQGSSSAVTVESVVRSSAYAAASSPSDASSERSSSGSGSKNGRTDSSSTSHSSPITGCVPNGSTEDEDCALSHYDYDVQSAAVALAQLSLAHDSEFVGAGTIPYALHKLGDPYRARWKVARSADSTTVREPFQPGNHPLSGPIQQLVASLPPRAVFDTLLDGYFQERNWEFGIPERWFRQSCEQMWRHLSLRCPGLACHVTGGCPRCTEELNPHWLSLTFAVLALAPHRLVGGNARAYFLKGMEARRLVEDILLASRASQPSAVQGIALSCIGAALLARYLADRGRVSDAWKLTGTALRNAQAVGFHRDPGLEKWDAMDKQERELRLLGWWSLIIADRTYSLILGRPMMANEGTFDVKLMPGDVRSEGSSCLMATFQEHYIGLCRLIGEMIEKCMGGITFPAYAVVLELDRKYKYWLYRLHESLDWSKPHPTSKPATLEERTLAYQRHILAAYYLSARMGLHRPYMMHAPPILPPPKPISHTMTVIMNPSRERCIELAMELLRVLCDAQEEAASWEPDPQLPAILFHYTYFVFDGAVALVGVFSQEPPHPQALECLELIDRAIRMLQWCVAATKSMANRDGEGETASRAITVLTALRKAGRWDERFRKRKPNGEEDPSAASVETSSQNAQDYASSYAQASGMSMTDSSVFNGTSYTAQETNPIPFLTAPATFPPFSFSGLLQMQSSATMPVPFGDGRDFTGPSSSSMPGAMPGFDMIGTNAARGTAASMQTMGAPFDMLQGGESFDVDWSAFAEIQGWPSNGLFGDT